jgi:hypothetical protein
VARLKKSDHADFIWTKEQCQEAYEDLVIKIAMSSYAELEGRELAEENERLKKHAIFKPTPEIENNIRRKVRRGLWRATGRRASKVLHTAVNRAACRRHGNRFRYGIFQLGLVEIGGNSRLSRI